MSASLDSTHSRPLSIILFQASQWARTAGRTKNREQLFTLHSAAGHTQARPNNMRPTQAFLLLGLFSHVSRLYVPCAFLTPTALPCA